MRLSSTKTEHGFTMIEVIIVIAIIATLVTFGMPALQKTANNQNIKGTARDIFSVFKKARIEAIKRNSNVVVAFSPVVYVSQGAAGSYQVFVDDGTGGGTADNHTLDGNETVLSTVNMPKQICLISAAFSGSTTNAGFTGRGLPTRMGSVQVRNADRWYQVSLSIAGNVSMTMSTDGVTFH